MSIIVIGVNHKTAPVALREKVFFAGEQLSLYLQDLLQQEFAKEAVLLSTCNRSELYCVADHIEPALAWFKAQTTDSHLLDSMLYCYQDEAALVHLTEVAVGLDSMVLGEPQIFGQLKEAFAESSSVGAIGAIFQHVFPHVFRIGKNIRTMTSIGACPVSVASAAVHFLRDKIGSLQGQSILLIGAGETTELLLRYLAPLAKGSVHLVNRSIERGQVLSNAHGAILHDWQRLSSCIESVDIVISATGSPTPIVTYGPMLSLMLKRSTRPLTLVDLAVPRDIDPAIMAIAGVSLYSIDDLMAVIVKHKEGRAHAAEKAREMIRSESMLFMQELASSEHVSHTIRAYRQQVEMLTQAELDKALSQLALGAEAKEVLTMFARSLTNKLLHSPSVTLRQVGKEGRLELLHFAKQLFAVSE